MEMLLKIQRNKALRHLATVQTGTNVFSVTGPTEYPYKQQCRERTIINVWFISACGGDIAYNKEEER